MSPPVSQLHPENLVLCGLLSTGCRSRQEPAPAWAFNALQLPSGHVCLQQCRVLQGLQVDLFAQLGGNTMLILQNPLAYGTMLSLYDRVKH